MNNSTFLGCTLTVMRKELRDFARDRRTPDFTDLLAVRNLSLEAVEGEVF